MVRAITIAVAAVSAVDILRRLWVRGRSLYSWTYIFENVAVGACIPLIFSNSPAEAVPEAILLGLGLGVWAFFSDLVLWYGIDKKRWGDDGRANR